MEGQIYNYIFVHVITGEQLPIFAPDYETALRELGYFVETPSHWQYINDF